MVEALKKQSSLLQNHLEEIRMRVKEMEEEAEKIQALNNEVEKQMNVSRGELHACVV